jgi:hypothetical protein
MKELARVLAMTALVVALVLGTAASTGALSSEARAPHDFPFATPGPHPTVGPQA